ncbi:hypothetical protein H311_03491 [Anncaliia algerae PRA109]|nr:hypothetical protein H311_03491 [Anncaliia algerae PRA109]
MQAYLVLSLTMMPLFSRKNTKNNIMYKEDNIRNNTTDLSYVIPLINDYRKYDYISITHNTTLDFIFKYIYKIIIERLSIVLSDKGNDLLQLVLKEEFSKIKEKWKIKEPDK